jgi:transcriptional regulator with XRE-family HTH domain
VDNRGYCSVFANRNIVMAMKQLREERNWSQEQLADLSGLGLRTIQRIEGSNKAGYESLRALAAAFEIEVSALELELAMDKSSTGWKRRPAWVRALFFGSGRIQMDSAQQRRMEKIGVASGIAFVLLATFGTKAEFVSADSKTPLLLFASLMFLSAYLTSLIIRIGDQHAVWPWVDSDTD